MMRLALSRLLLIQVLSKSMTSWDDYFIRLCDVVRSKSKDPSSKIGAVIVNSDHAVVSTGYNDFPRGIANDLKKWERPIKYKYVEHAERNAIYNAARMGASTKGCVLYLVGFGPPSAPCTDCTRAAIQAGIVEVKGFSYKSLPDHWADDLSLSLEMMQEAGVVFTELHLLPTP